MAKIAIIHDYLIDFGGAERVLLALHEIYPSAPIYVAVDRRKNLKDFAKHFDGAAVIESWFGKLPFANRLISPLRFLIPLIWKSFNLKEYDLLISSSSWAVTKGFDKNPKEIEICYCHTPPRYLYGFDTSRKFTGFFGRMVKIYGLVVNRFMRKYDKKQAQKVDYFVANSREVAERIKKFYGRDSTVIYPPIEMPKTKIEKIEISNRDYFLAGGRLVAAKNFDLIIKAFNNLELPLKIFGSGPLESYLKNSAKENIEFLGKVSDEEITKLYAGAIAFILAQKDEDFGMTSVEAMSFGTPVIAYKGGGYLESMIEGKTGIFFDELTEESLVGVVGEFNKSTYSKIKTEDCINQAKKFSKERFKKEMVQFIDKYAGITRS